MGKRANGEGSVYQRESDGRWVASISVGRGKRKHFLGHSRAEVAAKQTEALANQQKGIQPPSGKQTVSQFLDFWLKSVKSSVRPLTYQSYDLNVRRLCPLIGKLRLSNLKPAAIEAAYAQLQTDGLSRRSVRQAHTVLHGALKKAVMWELIGRNPSEAVSVPRPARHEMTTLSEVEVQQLFASTCEDRMHALWVLLTTTGLRLGEACGLQWQDIDLERGSLTVRRALQRQRDVGLVFVEPKTRHSRRQVHLPRGAIAVLAEHRKCQLEERLRVGSGWQDQDLVFCRQNGSSLEATNLLPEFHRALKAAGLPQIRLHDLRHTAATLLLKMGEHPKVVQEMLGHSTITLTLDTYSHVVPSMQEEAARKMQTLFANG